MEAGRGSYLCGLVLGLAVGVAGTHVAMSSRVAHRPPPALNLASNDALAPHIDLGPLDTYLPPLRDEFAPSPATVHAIATAPAESPLPEIIPAEAPRQLPELPHAAPLPVEPPREDAEFRAFIRDELQTQAASEHDIWYETLHGLSREDATEILRIWKMTRGADASIVPPEFARLAALPMENVAPAQRPVPSPAVPPATTPSETSSTNEFARTARRVCLHNIANAATPGFKRSELLMFERPITNDEPGLLEQSSSPIVWLNTSRAETEETGRPLDLAIRSAGFFQVQQGDETFLTRCGRFILDDSRRIALPRRDGTSCPLRPEVIVPEDCERLTITETGEVLASVKGAKAHVQLGKIELAQVLDPSALKPVGDNLLRISRGSGPSHPVPGNESINIEQGRFERSNVNIADERRKLEATQTLESPSHRQAAITH